MHACWNFTQSTAQARSSVIEDIRKAVNAQLLEILGALHEGADTILLLGPLEPEFWKVFKSTPEAQDGQSDPLDRWSKRIISQLAINFKASTHFPSDGPPYPPFISWALESGENWASPIGMLVHQNAGLFASYRGALRLNGHLALPAPTTSPCTPCAKPCKTACPVDALSKTSYNVEACKAHILGPDSKSCRAHGCAARSACPVSQTYSRRPEQSAFHMRAFLGE